MNKIARFAVVAAAAVSAMSPLRAQEATFSTNIPFEFHAGGKTFPAGLYRVLASSPNGYITVLGPNQTNVSMLLAPSCLRATDSPTLVFKRKGDQSLLSEIRFANQSNTILSKEPTLQAKVIK